MQMLYIIPYWKKLTSLSPPQFENFYNHKFSLSSALHIHIIYMIYNVVQIDFVMTVKSKDVDLYLSMWGKQIKFGTSPLERVIAFFLSFLSPFFQSYSQPNRYLSNIFGAYSESKFCQILNSQKPHISEIHIWSDICSLIFLLTYLHNKEAAFEKNYRRYIWLPVLPFSIFFQEFDGPLKRLQNRFYCQYWSTSPDSFFRKGFAICMHFSTNFNLMLVWLSFYKQTEPKSFRP